MTDTDCIGKSFWDYSLVYLANHIKSNPPWILTVTGSPSAHSVEHIPRLHLLWASTKANMGLDR